MARLLRLHFASIGHRDARLSPLTLDFREPGTRESVDTVLWLRNGGGKSSIINLFFSLFRPNRREFLGSSAEGGARKLEDYVRDTDLAWVVSEWSVPPGASRSRGAEPEGESTRIVGQVLAWQGQQQSTDTSRLKRLFFTFRSDAAALGFDTLPVVGLGTPVRSMQEAREFLDHAAAQHPQLEVVRTENQQKWRETLERVGLDPELFRYQLKMNQREGAADEVFRFRSPEEFIDFLLDVAFDGAGVEQTASLLSKQRDALRRRPEQELELTFVTRALEELAALVTAREVEEHADSTLALRLTELLRLSQAHEQRTERLRRDEAVAQRAVDEASTAQRAAENARDKHRRWAGGYQRLALELDLREAKVALKDEERHERELTRRRDAQRAALLWREVHQRQAEVAELTRTIEARQASLRPDLAALQAAGSRFRDALLAAERRHAQTADAAKAEREQAHALCDEARREADQAVVDRARAEAEATSCRAWLASRDRARARLVKDGHLTPRARAVEALADARADERRARDASEQHERARADYAHRAAESAERRAQWSAERAELSAQTTHMTDELNDACDLRARLSTEALICELEGVQEARPESDGLPRRLRSAAAQTRRQAMAAEVEGADDKRVLAAIDEQGLAPPPPAIEQVLGALDEAQTRAFYGPAYLARTATADAATRMHAEPSRYAGIIVQRAEDLERARALQLGRELRAGVTLSLPKSAQASSADDSTFTLPPDASTYDHNAARSLRDRLSAEGSQRVERIQSLITRQDALTDLAREVEVFQERYGSGRLDALRDGLESKQAHLGALSQQIAGAQREQQQLASKQAEEAELRDARAAKARKLSQSAAALAAFVDRFENEVADRRSKLDQAMEAQTSASAREEVARQAEDEAAGVRLRAQRRHEEQARRGQELAAERGRIAYQRELPEEVAAPTVGVDLDAARAAYRARKEDYEAKLGEGQLVGRRDALRDELAKVSARLTQAMAGAAQEEVEAEAGRIDLESACGQTEAELKAQLQRVAEAKVAARQALEAVNAVTRRRDAQDLPPGQVEPHTARDARTCVEREQAQAARSGEEARAEELRAVNARERARDAARAAEQLDNLRARLLQAADEIERSPKQTRTEAPGESTPALPELPAERDALVALVARSVASLREAHRTHRRSVEATQRAAARVTQVASDDRYVSLRHQYKVRLRADAAELSARAGEFLRELKERRRILQESLDDLNQNRAILLAALTKLGEEARRLIERAGRASEMPATLEGWAGKPYLQIRHRFPDTNEEALGRLGPFVDRLVQRAELPGGVELLKQTVRELSGSGLRVKILKPDARLRPDAVPIAEMSKFSRGQQLTAAILLYCTLVQLRARSRGQGRRVDDAGPLLLDNPIGTCSSVALLELQVSIAHQMGVQLIYATGVEDLEALDTLPNKIRLRNMHRDRRTGHHHVTHEEEATGHLEAVRALIATKP